MRRHEALLFRCAYPRSPRELEKAEAALGRIRLRDRLLDPEISGIAGTSVDLVFSWNMARWLTARYPNTTSIDWDGWSDDDRLATVLTPLVPELQERIVDANVPYLDYAKARSLPWYLEHLSPPTYDLLGLWVRWKFPDECSRTRMRRKPYELFFDPSIIARRDVSLERELASPPLLLRTLARDEGEAAIDMCRAMLAVRYRELYVPTFADPSNVLSAEAGRGLEIVLLSVLPEKRLPVRSGFAPFFFRNGVPAGYGDAYLAAPRIEVSFNIFPAFREGESAWIFARLLRLYRQLFDVNRFTIDPYQIGLGNEEAIESGAFWFYRKLGFRSTDARVERLARSEERRGRRSKPQMLRNLATSAMELTL
ncbi:MAG TPA: hypothetical protein VLV86_18015 [Vicinamibacterales bacterium]|nr:hypothetical protein [Vicinamibacterales bacterium]